MIDSIFGKNTRYGNIWKNEKGKWWDKDDKGNPCIPQTPDGLIFTAYTKIERKKSYLTLLGWLENKTNFLLEVPIFPAPSIFYLKIKNTNQIKTKQHKGPNPPYQVPPPPHVLFIDGHNRIQFTAGLNLNNYEYSPGVKAEIEWTFSYWHEPKPRGLLNYILDS